MLNCKSRKFRRSKGGRHRRKCSGVHLYCSPTVFGCQNFQRKLTDGKSAFCQCQLAHFKCSQINWHETQIVSRACCQTTQFDIMTIQFRNIADCKRGLMDCDVAQLSALFWRHLDRFGGLVEQRRHCRLSVFACKGTQNVDGPDRQIKFIQCNSNIIRNCRECKFACMKGFRQ